MSVCRLLLQLKRIQAYLLFYIPDLLSFDPGVDGADSLLKCSGSKGRWNATEQLSPRVTTTEPVL